MQSERHETPFGAMIVFPHVIQGSEEWEKMRRGRPTASNFSKILTAAKWELSKSAVPYMYKIIGDMFSTDVSPSFIGNAWTDRGQLLEPEARKAFTACTGYETEQVGFVTREDKFVGCSPDGLILDPRTQTTVLAGLELKCPAPETHVSYVHGGGLPDEHKAQVHGGLAVTGLAEWHFFSYCPGMRPFHVVQRRNSETEKLSVVLDQFVIDLVALKESLTPKLKLPPARGE